MRPRGCGNSQGEPVVREWRSPWNPFNGTGLYLFSTVQLGRAYLSSQVTVKLTKISIKRNYVVRLSQPLIWWVSHCLFHTARWVSPFGKTIFVYSNMSRGGSL